MNAPRAKSSVQVEIKSHSGHRRFRDAILVILSTVAGAAVAWGITALNKQDSNPQRPGIAASSSPDPDTPKRPDAGVPRSVFVRSNTECSKLTDEEILITAEQVRARIAQKIIDDLGITNEDQKKEIRNCVSTNHTVAESVEDDILTLSSQEPGSADGGTNTCTIDLDDAEKEDPLKGVAPELFIRQFDMQKIITAVEDAGLDDVLGNEMAAFGQAHQEFMQAKTSGQKNLAACRLYYRLPQLGIKVENLDDDSIASMRRVNTDLDQFYEALKRFFQAEEDDNEDVCYRAMSEASICIPNGQ